MPGPLNILLVEDHDDEARATALLLSRGGHAVTRVGTVAGAAALCACVAFDLVISDRQLPDGDAAALFAEGGPCHRTPAVVVSGRAGDDFPATAAYRAYLLKPFEFPTLLAAIERAAAASPPPASS